jgi:hypothetical protein
MSYIKLITSPILIATLTSSVLASFTSIANARPEFRRVMPNTQITGNILKGDSTIENIFCERISVTMTEFIPIEPKPNQFNVPKQKYVVQPVSAIGNHLGEGCSHSLVFSYLPKIRRYGESTFQISAQAGGIVGEQSVSYPFFNQIDIKLFSPPPVPR